MEKEFDIYGIGNPLMDMMFEVKDELLEEFEFEKGVMHLIDEAKTHALIGKLRHSKIVPAGATTNTLMGVSALGGKCILTGMIGDGPYADIYEGIIVEEGIVPRLHRSAEKRTGKVLNFVTPDAERTFGVHLGAAVTLQKESILEEDIERCKCLYLTGYEYESLNGAVLHSMRLAEKHDALVALDLADPMLIQRNLQDLKELVSQHVDILFMNEREAKAFTGLPPAKAAEAMKGMVDICVIKMGAKGSYIITDDAIQKVPSYPVRPIDTTGAGDLFAAGFLYSVLTGKDLREAAKVGSYMGSLIITHLGARMTPRMKKDAKMMFEMT